MTSIAFLTLCNQQRSFTRSTYSLDKDVIFFVKMHILLLILCAIAILSFYIKCKLQSSTKLQRLWTRKPFHCSVFCNRNHKKGVLIVKRFFKNFYLFNHFSMNFSGQLFRFRSIVYGLEPWYEIDSLCLPQWCHSRPSTSKMFWK